MSLFEKVAWYNLAVLGIGFVFYLLTLDFISSAFTFQMSYVLFCSSMTLLMLCNFAWIIYYKREGNDSPEGAKPDAGGKNMRIDIHLLYWGTFILVLAGTGGWTFYMAAHVVSDKLNTLLVTLGLGFFFSYVGLFIWYKNRKAESAFPCESYSSVDVLLQKALPGHDERDLLIRKTSRRHSLIILSVVLSALCLIGGIMWAQLNPEIFAFSVRTAYIPLLFSALMLLRHLVIQISTIVQYRLGR